MTCTLGKCTLSLVAELSGELVGHILFSAVAIEGVNSHLSALGLTPLAVLTEFQRKGRQLSSHAPRPRPLSGPRWHRRAGDTLSIIQLLRSLRPTIWARLR